VSQKQVITSLTVSCKFVTVRLQFFGTLIIKTIGHRQVFLFSHLTYRPYCAAVLLWENVET